MEMEARNRKLARLGRSHPHVDGNQPRTFHPGKAFAPLQGGRVGGTATAVSDMPASRLRVLTGPDPGSPDPGT